ncbi:MAG TPA: DUF167 domain-containing protein [Candidatus Nanoarchaeia archaeon]|nr:DUF167 domain-containing protein [Candidatus Nanoarchaeia archaeon]
MQILKVKVKPNSPETRVISQSPEELVLAISAPAENNKANIELLKFLKKHFKSKVEIVRGLKSRTKIIRVT